MYVGCYLRALTTLMTGSRRRRHVDVETKIEDWHHNFSYQKADAQRPKSAARRKDSCIVVFLMMMDR